MTDINAIKNELQDFMTDQSIPGVVDLALLEIEQVVQVIVSTYPHMDAIQQWALTNGYASCILVAVDAD